MIVKLIQDAITFVASNPMLVGMIFSFTAWVKSFQAQFPQLKDWILTVVAFVIGILFAIPEGPLLFSWAILFNGIALGVTATGVYKGASFIAVKGQQGKQA